MWFYRGILWEYIIYKSNFGLAYIYKNLLSFSIEKWSEKILLPVTRRSVFNIRKYNVERKTLLNTHIRLFISVYKYILIIIYKHIEMQRRSYSIIVQPTHVPSIYSVTGYSPRCDIIIIIYTHSERERRSRARWSFSLSSVGCVDALFVVVRRIEEELLCF